MREDKDEAIRLRTEERLSYKEISEKLGVSKGTLSGWLKGTVVLSKAEVDKRRRPYVTPKKDRGQASQISTLVDVSKLTRFQKGRIAEAAALLRVSLFGLESFHAIGDGSREDLIVRVEGGTRYAKIQVKWIATGTSGLPTVRLRYNVNSAGNAKRYTREDFDFIVGYDIHSNICYVYSYNEVEHLKAAVTINIQAAEKWSQVVDFCNDQPNNVGAG